MLDHVYTGKLALLAVAAISFGALAAALVAQYVFGMEPCVLCVYQRWPFLIAGLIGLVGFVFANARIRAMLLLACALTFLVNTAIAIFHVGVEQKWWRGTQACHVPDLSSVSSTEEFMAMLEAASVTPCDVIPWSVYGVSMAGMNVILCALMAVFCMASAIYVVRKANGF